MGVPRSPIGRLSQRGPALLLALAVGLAFADTAIVMLGLPEIYGAFGGSVVGVSLVATSYNLVVAVVALALLPVVRRVRPALVVVVGLTIFAATAVGAGLSGSLGELIAWRAAQGVGAAMVLAASLSLLIALTGSSAAGRRWWIWAGTAGVALGPVLGGVLTEVFDWRAIFLAQAPVAALALAGAITTTTLRVRPEGVRVRPAPGASRANLGLVFAFGGLAGALFLAVLMVVTVWDLGPLTGALILSALPAAALMVRPLGAHAGPDAGAPAGALLLAAGLAALAFLPATDPLWAAAALAVCGAGFGLVVPVLTRRSVADDRAPSAAATISVSARHVGLVAALVLVAPLLAAGLETGAERASQRAAAAILDADLPLRDKVPIAAGLAEAFRASPDGELPDLREPFEGIGDADDPAVRVAREDLRSAVASALTAAFRSSYLVAAALALLALIPLTVARREPGAARRAAPTPALGALVLGAFALVVGQLAAGGAQLGRAAAHDPCAPRAAPDRSGIDAALQQIARDGLDGAACELGMGREELVLALAPEAPGAPKRHIAQAEVERATRAGLLRAVDDAERRGSIGRLTAALLRSASHNAPVGEALDLYSRGRSFADDLRSGGGDAGFAAELLVAAERSLTGS